MAEDVEIARFYRTKKYPKVMGRFYDGTKIPGGPYTMTQGVVAAVMLFLVINTNPIWTQGNILFDLPLGGGVVWGVAWLAGRIRTGNRNPAQLLIGLVHASFAPGLGSYNGIPIREKRPHSGYSRVITDLPRTEHRPADVGHKADQPEPASTSAAVPAPSAEIPRATTAVERLLAQTTR